MSKRKSEKFPEEEEQRGVDNAVEKYTPLEWAFRTCQDEAYYDVNGIMITARVEIVAIRDIPVEAIRLGDLKSIASISEWMQQIVDEQDANKMSDDKYVLMESFMDDMIPYRIGRRYTLGDKTYLSKCYIDAETGEPTESIPHDFWAAFKASVPEEKWKPMTEGSFTDILFKTSEGTISASSLNFGDLISSVGTSTAEEGSMDEKDSQAEEGSKMEE